MSDKTWVVGEFVETVQLQVVCQTLLNKLSSGASEITEDDLEAYGNIDSALKVFYEDSIRDTLEETRKLGVKEGLLRNWFEKKLITPAETRGLVYRGNTHTDGLINEAVDVLDRAHIIREERRGGGRWYELSHDRFIYPIKDSNKQWLLQYSSAARTRDWLEQKAALWAAGRSDEALLNESELPEAERWLEAPEAAELGSSPEVANLVQASRLNLRNRESQRRLELQNAIKEARSARRFRRLSYALGVVCIIAIAAVVVAARYAVKARQLKAEGLKLSDVAHAALQEAADAQNKAKDAQTSANVAQNHANHAQKEANDAQSRADGALIRARAEAANAAIQKRKAEARAKEVDEAYNFNALTRDAFVLSRRSENKEEAIQKFQSAVTFYRKIHDYDSEAGTNVTIGEIYRDLRETDRAEEFFNNAIDIYRRAHPDEMMKAKTLNSIGLVFSSGVVRGDDLKRGKEEFSQALAIYRNKKDVLGEAATLVNLGDIHLRLGDDADHKLAGTYYGQALDLYSPFVDIGGSSGPKKDLTKDGSRERAMRAAAALLLSFTDHIQELLEADELRGFGPDEARLLYAGMATALYDQLKDDKGRAFSNSKAAAVYEQLYFKNADKKRDEYKKDVIDGYSKVAEIYAHQQPRNAAGEGWAFIKLGNFYEKINDPKNAADAFEKALHVYESAEDRAGVISALNRIGDFYRSQAGKTSVALPLAQVLRHYNIANAVEAYRKVIKHYEELGNSSGRADKYLQIVRLYHDDNDEQKAAEAFKQAREVYRQANDSKSEADRIAEIADYYDRPNADTRSLESAFVWFTEASEIYHKSELKILEAVMYHSAAEVCLELAQKSPGQEGTYYARAIEQYLKEAEIYKPSEDRIKRLRRANVLVTVAKLFRDKLHDKAKALSSFNEALDIYTKVEYKWGADSVREQIKTVTEPPKP